MTDMTYVDPNDFVEFKDASKLQKDDFVYDADGQPLYRVLNKDFTSSGLICMDMQNGGKATINPQGIQHYIGTEGWTCRRYGEASKGVKISEEDEQAIAETLRLAGVKLNEGEGLFLSDDEKKCYAVLDENKRLVFIFQNQKNGNKVMTYSSDGWKWDDESKYANLPEANYKDAKWFLDTVINGEWNYDYELVKRK